MNEIIKRYIYDVTRRLPEKDRAEVSRELEANISDMLPENPSEQDIIILLTKLGAPRILAEQYRQNPRYLISPAIFELYIMVLKMVTLIVACVFACIGAFSAISSGLVGEIIISAISSAAEGAVQSALWVTLGFVIAERSGAYKEKPWTVDDLPNLPEQNGVSISRSDTIIGMALTVIFTVVFVTVILRGEWFLSFVINEIEIINPFTQEVLTRSVPYIIALGVLSLLVSLFKLLWGRWNVSLCVINAAHNLISVSIMIYILYWPDLLSAEFLAFAERTFTYDADIIKYILTDGMITFFSAVFIIIAIIDTGITGYKTWKGMRETEKIEQ